MYFSGETYDHERDGVRLAKQWWDVWRFMLDGEWRTLSQISQQSGHPMQSISARLRDFRKKRFGSHTVERRYLHDGIWEYRVCPNPLVQVEKAKVSEE